MNAYQHKHTGEIRNQKFSPGDDWILLVPMTNAELLLTWAIIVACVGVLIWLNGSY